MIIELSENVIEAIADAVVKKMQEPQLRDCKTCTHSEEQDGSNCYECVKGMAIKALEQQPCEDCVARSEALDILDDFEEDIENGKFKTAYAKARERMCELPSVTPQPKIGRWIAEIDDYGEVMRWHCDKCYEDSGFTTTCKWDFCPNCGAKMEVEE